MVEDGEGQFEDARIGTTIGLSSFLSKKRSSARRPCRIEEEAPTGAPGLPAARSGRRSITASAPTRSSRATASSRSRRPSSCVRRLAPRRASSCSRRRHRLGMAPTRGPMRSRAQAGACSTRLASGGRSKAKRKRWSTSSSPTAGSTMGCDPHSFPFSATRQMMPPKVAGPSRIWSRPGPCGMLCSVLPMPQGSKFCRFGSKPFRMKAMMIGFSRGAKTGG